MELCWRMFGAMWYFDLKVMIKNVFTDVLEKISSVAMIYLYYVLFNSWIMLQLTVLQTVGILQYFLRFDGNLTSRLSYIHV